MTNDQCSNIWTTDQSENLYDNWEYFIDNKKEAERLLQHNWNGIIQKARRINLKTRNTCKKSNNNILISTELKETIDGCLLSDGYLSKCGVCGSFSQNNINIEWLDNIKDCFSEYDIISTINIQSKERYVDFSNISPDKNICKCKQIYILDTSHYIEFKDLYNKWYLFDYEYINKYNKLCDKYKKSVPNDLKLTPKCVAYWYFGDGSKHKNRKNYITLSTQGFSIDNVNMLRNKLENELDIMAGNPNKSNTIIISNKRSVYLFLDYIKPYKISCFNYKFNT